MLLLLRSVVDVARNWNGYCHGAVLLLVQAVIVGMFIAMVVIMVTVRLQLNWLGAIELGSTVCNEIV